MDQWINEASEEKVQIIQTKHVPRKRIYLPTGILNFQQDDIS